MQGLTGERQRKTLTFTQQDAAIGQPFCHHGDQLEALGKGPEVMRKRAEGKRRERGGARQGEEGRGGGALVGQLAGGGGRGKGSSEETRGGGRVDGGEEQGEGGEGKQGLSAFDVKSLRQKHSRAECCSTCAGSPQCQRQLGDGEDEGGEMKTGT